MRLSKTERQYHIDRLTNKIALILLYNTILEQEGIAVPQRNYAAIQHLQRERYSFFTLRQKITYRWIQFFAWRKTR